MLNRKLCLHAKGYRFQKGLVIYYEKTERYPMFYFKMHHDSGCGGTYHILSEYTIQKN